MQHDEGVYLGHMLDTAQQLSAMFHNKTRQQFDADPATRYAAAYLIQIIGEAARRVSSTTQSAHPEIAWQDIIGMRHKIVHDYMNIDDDIVWVVISNDLPALIQQLQRFVT